jgi:hypothetical protein
MKRSNAVNDCWNFVEQIWMVAARVSPIRTEHFSVGTGEKRAEVPYVVCDAVGFFETGATVMTQSYS